MPPASEPLTGCVYLGGEWRRRVIELPVSLGGMRLPGPAETLAGHDEGQYVLHGRLR